MSGKSWIHKDHGAKLDRAIIKLDKLIVDCNDVKVISTLVNSLGYVINIHANMRRTEFLALDIEDLQKRIGLTGKVFDSATTQIVRPTT